jgi:hypothetical protein
MRNSADHTNGIEVVISFNVENIVNESDGVAIVTPFFIFIFVENQFNV